jgi:indole-3-glycerol phosphate synthase
MILDEILKAKKVELKGVRSSIKLPIDHKELPELRDFAGAISKSGMNLIAEVKAASPSAGGIVENYDPAAIAKIYEKAGASAISVLTEKNYFKGSIDHIKAVRSAVKLPILRKDFIIDQSQIYESRLAGADAVLLIARILKPEQLKKFITIAADLCMTALVEVHTVQEARAALDAGAKVIGINNRDLDTLKVDINNTPNIIKGLPKLKEGTLVSESGIKDRGEVETLRSAGVSAILVGESLLRSKDITLKVKELIG